LKRSCPGRFGLESILRLGISLFRDVMWTDVHAAPRKARSMNADEKISQNDLLVSRCYHRQTAKRLE